MIPRFVVNAYNRYSSLAYHHLVLMAVPISFTVGAAMELFMIKTGFYHIVTIKESERLADRINEQQRQVQRLKELQINIDIECVGEKTRK